jgi:hypothetical protein
MLGVIGSGFAMAQVIIRQGENHPSDQSVAGSYTAPDGTLVEVVGVCKVTEESVACWTGTGDKNPDLEARVKQTLKDAARGLPFPSIAFGKKNRLVFFKATKPANSSTVYDGVERVEGGRASPYFLGGMATPEERTDGLVTWFAAAAVTDSDSHKVSVQVRHVRWLDEIEEFKPKVGATFKYSGINQIVREIKDVSKTSPMMLQPGDKLWQISVESKTPTSGSIDLWLTALNKSGETLEFADDKGNGLTAAERKRQSDQRFKEMQKYKPEEVPMRLHVFALRPAVQGPMERKGNLTKFTMYVNPSKVDKMRAKGQLATFIEFKDIALDPK